MKTKLQMLALLCLALVGCARAQSHLGGTGKVGGTAGYQSLGTPKLQLLPPFQFSTAVGASFSQTLSSAYGVGTLTWSEIGTLPAGLSLNSGTGVISGTVGNNAGIYSFTVTVTDSSSPAQVATQNMSISVLCTPLQLTGPATWPPADAGVAYNYTVPVSGGIAPLTFAATNLPSAEIINTSTGVVSGTPAAAGISSNIGITVTDSCPTGTQTVNGTYTEQVNATLAITTPPTLTPATTGVAYSTQLTAAGGTPPYTNWAITAGSLPTGLGLNPSTGVIAGTPTGVGTSTFTVQVTDSAAGTASLAMSLAVACTPLSISTPNLPSGTQNQLYSFQEQSTGGYGAISWSGSGFPSGIAISNAGLVSGTPTNFGTFTPGIAAQDSCPVPQKVNINPTLVIAQQVGQLVITTGNPLPDEIVGQAVNFNMAASGGVPPYTWSNPTGSFPAMVTMNGAGLISGTPTTAGTYTPTIQVTDTQPVSVSQAFSITVTCPAESITTTSLPPATKGTAYSFTVQGTGGILPITWGATGLPSGLTIGSSSGTISGTPTASGTFAVVITRTDSCLPSGTAVSVTLSLQVNNPPLAITTPSPLPNATLNQAYSTTLSAAGGTPPYTWSITAGGPLQTGLSLTGSTGVISGTPSATGTVTPTFQVTDSASNTATATLSLTVASASGDDSRYCSQNGTWTGPATKGPASAPKTCVYSPLSATPASGPTVTPTAGSCSSLQSAVNSATAGTIISVPHLNGGAQDQFASCTIKPAATCSAINWCWIIADDSNNLPAEGTRISPAWAGIQSLPGREGYNQPTTAGIYIPKIIAGGNFAIQFQGTAAYWRVMGLEITSPAGQSAAQLISGTPGWNHILIDRDVIHGGNSSVGQDRDSIQAGVALNGCQFCAVIDTYNFDTHCVIGNCQSAGIAMGGNSTTATGPLKIVNNYDESAGENLFAGGGGQLGATILPSSDVEIRRNDVFKPMFWQVGDPSYFGTKFELDNLMELKNSQRVWIEGNVFQHSTGSQGTQQGNAIGFGPRNQSNGCCSGTASSDGAGNITWISGTKFNSTLVSITCGVDPGHCMFVYNSLAYEVKTFNSATSVTLQLCVTGCKNAGGISAGATLPPILSSANFLAYSPGLNPNAVNLDMIFINNYTTGAARQGWIATAVSDGGDLPLALKRVYIANNGTDDIDGWVWNNKLTQACCVWGTGWQVQGANSTLFPDQIVIDHNTIIQFLTGGKPGLGPDFMWGLPKSPVMTSFQVTNNVSAGGVGTGGSAESVVTGAAIKSGLCFDHNFFTSTVNPFGPNGNGNYTDASNPPYPAAGDSGGCSFGASGNTVVTDFNAMQFTAPNGGTNVNMQLSATSPGHNAASDGSDVGVNWNTLQTAIAGVAGGPVTSPIILTTADSALNSYSAVTNTYNAPGTSGPNGPIGTNKWLMYPDPFGINTGSGTIVQAYPGTGSMTFTQSLSGLPGAGVDAFPFVLYGCDPFSNCYNGQPPQFPAALNSMTNLYADINYTLSGTITGRDIDLLFDEWVCNNSHPTNSTQCLEVEIIPYYNFLVGSGATFVKTITVPVTINGSATTLAFDEYKGGNILFIPHSLPGTSSQELKFDLLTFLNEGVATFGANGPCTPTACSFLAGVELGTEFGDAATQSYALQFTKIALTQILP